MLFHHLADTVDIAFRLVILDLQVVQLVGAFFEKAQDALFFFLCVELFQLGYHASQHLADLTHILGTHIIQRIFGEVGNFLLAAGTVLQD